MTRVEYRPARRKLTDAVFEALGDCLREGLIGREIAERLNAQFPAEMSPPLNEVAVYETIRNFGGREAILSGQRSDRQSTRGRTSAASFAAGFASQLAVIEDEVFRPNTVMEAQWAADGAALWSRDPLSFEQVYALLRPGHARARDFGFYVRHPETGRREPAFDALLDEWMPFDEIVRRGRAYFAMGKMLSETSA